MASTPIVEMLRGMSLFADLTRPQAEAVAHTFEEAWFTPGDRVLRRDFGGGGFYVIADGTASVRLDGEERARLARGDFFGEVSLLLGEAPTADIVAETPLHCLVLAGPDLDGFLMDYPQVMLRMLRAEAHRLRTTLTWQG